MESGNSDQGSGTDTYDRRTEIWGGLVVESIVKSCGISWIIVQGSDSIFALSSDKDKTMVKSLLPQLLKDEIVNPFLGQRRLAAPGTKSRSSAVISVTLGANNGEGICDIKQSLPRTVNLQWGEGALLVIPRTKVLFSINSTHRAANTYLRGREAANFLQERLKKHSGFTDEETMQTGIFALRIMVPVGLNPNDIEVCVVRKVGLTTEALSVAKIKKFLAVNSESESSKWKRQWRSEEIGECTSVFTIRADGVRKSRFIDGDDDSRIDDCGGNTAMSIVREDDSLVDDCSGNMVMSGKESKGASSDDYPRSIKTSGEEERIQEGTSGVEEIDQGEKESSYTHITRIWYRGWDYRSVKSSRFNWIGVTGKDAICVVTADKISIDSCDLESALLEMTDHPLSMKISDIDEWSADCATLIPFAAVAMVNVDEESYEVSTLGLNGKEAMSFLTEQVENELNFTYEETIKTAFGALLYFWDDIKADDVKACVLRKGEETEKQLSSEEIEECLSMAPLLK